MYIFIFFYFGFIATTLAQGSYRAAVVEYAPLREPFFTPTEILKYNAEEYAKFIEKAAHQGATIIVFPEDGLTTMEIRNKSAEQLHAYSIEVPHPNMKINPCVHESHHKALRLLACAANANDIYVVANVLEKYLENGKSFFYITTLVIDRAGTVIARYRKINLFHEPNFNRGYDLVTFTTDFNVTFGIFTSLDIFYKNPALNIIKDKKITDIVYSTAWFSETPYLHGLSVQAGYARATGVNLLAAGLCDPAQKNGGSGIYINDGRIAELYISPSKSSRLLVQDVPKIKVKLSAVKCNNNSQAMPRFRLGGNLNVGTFSTYTENMTTHTLIPLNQNGLETNATVCNFNGIYCCKFHVVLGEALTKQDPLYRLALFYDVRQMGDTTVGIRSCGLVACLNKDKNTCGGRIITSKSKARFTSISIQGTFRRTEDTYDQPITLTYELIPVTEYTYCETLSDNKKEVVADMKTTQPLTNLMSFGIHGRLFEYDGASVRAITNAGCINNINFMNSVMFILIGISLILAIDVN